MQPYIHNSIIHNSQDTETTQMPIDTRMDKENVKHLEIANLSIKLHDLHKDKVPSADNILELEILLDQAVKNLYLNQ